MFSREQLQKEEQRYYLSSGGVVGEIVFGKGENLVWKKFLIKDFEEIWGQGGYLVLKEKIRKVDYRIEFVDEVFRKGEDAGFIRKRKSSQDYYIFQMRWDKKTMRVRANYMAGVAGINMMLREAYIRLAARKNYLLIHAATCTKDEKAYILMVKSGGGKSTTREAMMKQGWKRMGDDLLMVDRNEGEWRYTSLPFVEKSYLPQKRETRSAVLCFIHKTKKPAWIKKVKEPVVMIKKIVKQTFVDYSFGVEKVSEMAIAWASEQRVVFELGVLLKKTDFSKIFKEGENES